jgi:hypothetical protein
MAQPNKRTGTDGPKTSRKGNPTLVKASPGKGGSTKTGANNDGKRLTGRKNVLPTTDNDPETRTASGMAWFAPQYDETGKTIKFLIQPSLIPSINDHKGDDDEMPRWSKMRGASVKTVPFLPEELQDEKFRNTTSSTITTALHKHSIHDISYHSTLCTKLIQILALGKENGKAEKVFVQLATRFSKTPPRSSSRLLPCWRNYPSHQ